MSVVETNKNRHTVSKIINTSCILNGKLRASSVTATWRANQEAARDIRVASVALTSPWLRKWSAWWVLCSPDLFGWLTTLQESESESPDTCAHVRGENRWGRGILTAATRARTPGPGNVPSLRQSARSRLFLLFSVYCSMLENSWMTWKTLLWKQMVF